MDWLPHNNHTENEDQKIARMSINVNAISTSVNMLVCTSIEDILAATKKDAYLQELATHGNEW